MQLNIDDKTMKWDKNKKSESKKDANCKESHNIHSLFVFGNQNSEIEEFWL